MAKSAQKHPIHLLYEIEQQCKKTAKGLPQRVDVKESWTGIGFRIGGLNLVAPLKQVNEILHYPRLTAVPGTQRWVKGVANIRGTLLPIVDLQGFLQDKPLPQTVKSRVLVVKREDLSVGLVVSEVLGLKHFQDHEKVTSVSRFDEALRGYVHGAFKQNSEEILVFSMYTLADNPAFFQVAV
ncbi:MAG TPA: chemotaxis protein CheW [Gammaproteobacteria bacterium]